eukprot:scaffold844_cov254-Pinguiococcus_pyrenoidosus.AAC.6
MQRASHEQSFGNSVCRPDNIALSEQCTAFSHGSMFPTIPDVALPSFLPSFFPSFLLVGATVHDSDHHAAANELSFGVAQVRPDVARSSKSPHSLTLRCFACLLCLLCFASQRGADVRSFHGADACSEVCRCVSGVCFTLGGLSPGAAIALTGTDPLASDVPTPAPSLEPSSEPTLTAVSPAPSSAPTEVIRPQLVGAIMADSGATVLITFDLEVDVSTPVAADSFPCSLVFSQDALVSEVCSYSSPTTMRMIMSGESTLVPGDFLSLLDGSIAAACVNTLGNACGTNVEGEPIAILPPANPLKPIVQLSYAALGTACEDEHIVDASGSFNSGGRPWQQILWEILPSSLGEQGQFNELFLESLLYMQSVLDGASETLVFNTSQLVPDTPYRLNLTLGNFLGEQISEGPIEFEIADTSRPIAKLSGPANELASPNQVYSVSSVLTEACDGSQSNETSLNFTGWLAIDSGGEVLDLEVEVSNTQQIVVAPYQFEPGETYTLFWTGSVGGSDEVETIEVSKSIEVTELPLSPSIQGCFVTVSPVNAGGTSVVHLVDASESSDPNLGDEGSVEAQDAVAVSFEAKAYDNKGLASFTEDAGREPSEGCNVTANSVVTGEGKVLEVNATALQGCDVVVNVTVESTTRSSTAGEVCIFRVLSTASPDLSIVSSFAGSKVNPDEKLAILADLGSSSGVDASIEANWTLIAGSFQGSQPLSAVAITPITYSYPPVSLADGAIVPVNLGIGLGSLREGFAYSFSLQAAYVGGQEDFVALPAEASVQLVVNERPTSGTLDVTPKVGDFQALFTLVASGWVDEDIPLQYFFRVQPDPEKTDVLDLNPSVSVNRLQTNFPPGPTVSFYASRIHLELSLFGRL